ncbi:MAG TPA: hypothetical protein VED85_05045 [Burkholderiaceae bacterium]|nr:hypothetical protein [Burkholderiaceae bacterium]
MPVTVTPAQGSASAAAPDGAPDAGVLAETALAVDAPEVAAILLAEGVALGDDSLAPQAMSSKIDNTGGKRL